jgi:predicted metal-dependent phosphoesterase TrpH
VRIELHCHSTCSDGTEAPAAVAARAAARGVTLFALTDHDSCAGSAAAVAEGLAVVRAVELSCDEGGHTVHVLAFDRGGAWPLIEAKLEEVRVARRNRLTTMAAKLRARGIAIDVAPLLAVAETRAVGRPDLARAMVAAGAATSVRDAFDRHLYDRGPVDVPHRALPVEVALAIGREAGAAMSLAHPHLLGDRAPSLLRKYKPAGLEGIEAWYGPYDPRTRARWTKVADTLDLVCTGGSDWHGPEAGGPEPGVELPEDRAARLRAWLGRAA